MRLSLATLFVFSFGALFCSSLQAQELSAAQIVEKSLDQNRMGVQSGQAQIDLIIKDKEGVTRERKLEVRSKDVGGLGRSRVELLAPKEVKGQAFLFVERASEDDVWMYLPAFKVTRRLESGQKKGSFLGSHFSYADLESRDLKDGVYKKLPDEKIGKHDVYVIDSTPKDGANSEYSRVTSYIRKSDFTPLKVKFYGKSDGKLVKTLFVEKLDKTPKGETYAKQMKLKATRGGSTTMRISSISESEIPDSTFSKEQLGK